MSNEWIDWIKIMKNLETRDWKNSRDSGFLFKIFMWDLLKTEYNLVKAALGLIYNFTTKLLNMLNLNSLWRNITLCILSVRYKNALW